MAKLRYAKVVLESLKCVSFWSRAPGPMNEADNSYHNSRPINEQSSRFRISLLYTTYYIVRIMSDRRVAVLLSVGMSRWLTVPNAPMLKDRIANFSFKELIAYHRKPTCNPMFLSSNSPNPSKLPRFLLPQAGWQMRRCN